jgi:type II secretory pathway pseudopilin PulG
MTRTPVGKVSRHNHVGFTIAELMVVIALIVLIGSLLLPALQLAREESTSTLCRKNLKQLAQAVYRVLG